MFLLDSVLAGYMFLEACPFLLGCIFFFWHLAVNNIFLRYFVFL